MTVLEEIFEHKAEEVASAKRHRTPSDVRSRARDESPPRGFLKALESADRPLALIAEVKKASPSQGIIRAQFDAVEVARAYEEAGAHALSVLTDERYFHGSAENLSRARAATKLPCLRKDFINDPYQVDEARAMGADAILLIASVLERSQLEDLRDLATEWRMDTLVEVHNAEETHLALSLKCPLIGVNNRDLRDFTTSISVSEDLLAMIAGKAIGVSESALRSREDLDRVEAAGARAVLIGTAFCAAPNIAEKVREVMGWECG